MPWSGGVQVSLMAQAYDVAKLSHHQITTDTISILPKKAGSFRSPPPDLLAMDNVNPIQSNKTTQQQLQALWLSAHASRRKFNHATAALLIALLLLLYYLCAVASHPLVRLKLHWKRHRRRERLGYSDASDTSTRNEKPIDVFSTFPIPKQSSRVIPYMYSEQKPSEQQQEKRQQQQSVHNFQTRDSNIPSIFWSWKAAPQSALTSLFDTLSFTPSLLLFGRPFTAAPLQQTNKIQQQQQINVYEHVTNNNVPDVPRQNIRWSCVLKCMGSNRAYGLFLKCSDECKDWILYDRNGFFQYLGACVAKLLLFCVSSIVVVALLSCVAACILEVWHFNCRTIRT